MFRCQQQTISLQILIMNMVSSILTLSSTAPGSMPNLSAMGTIRSGRLQLFVDEWETLVKFGFS